eukprot:420913_1
MSTIVQTITNANDESNGVHCGTNRTNTDTCKIKCENESDRKLIPRNCHKKRCMRESVINATLARTLTINATNMECLKLASVYLPIDGSATIIIDTQGVSGMDGIAKEATFYSQSTHHIDLTCHDP